MLDTTRTPNLKIRIPSLRKRETKPSLKRIEFHKSLYNQFDELKLWNRSLKHQQRKLHALFENETGAPSEKKNLVQPDENFMNKIQEIIEAHLSDSDFSVADLSREMGLSRVHLYRKLKAFTDDSPSAFIRNFRLQKASYMLENQIGTISEVAYRTGFNDISHFSKSFKKVFGVCPSHYSNFEFLRF